MATFDLGDANLLFEELRGIELCDMRCFQCPAKRMFFEQVFDKKAYIYALERAMARRDYLWIAFHSLEFMKLTETIMPGENPFATVAVREMLVFTCQLCNNIHCSLTEYAEGVINQNIYTSLEDIERFGHFLEEYISVGRDDLSVNDLYYSYLRYSTMCRTQEAKAQVLKSLCNRIRFLYSADIEPEQSELEDEI